MPTIPKRIRAYDAEVTEIVEEGAGWQVETPCGSDLVDERGEGGWVLPYDSSVAVDFIDHGNGLLIRPTAAGHQELDQRVDWKQIDQSLGHGGGAGERDPHHR